VDPRDRCSPLVERGAQLCRVGGTIEVVANVLVDAHALERDPEHLGRVGSNR
jgi:hypothetical protein